MSSVIHTIFHALISGLFVTSIPNFFFHKSLFSFLFPSPVLAAAPDIILHSTSNFSTCPLPYIA